MMWTVVDEMAALTEAFQVSQAIIARIMIKMRRGEDDAGKS
jgi:hypothetical protein